MEAHEHPDFEQEKERLAYTKAYIQAVLEQAEKNRSDFQGNIKEALVELDHLDSSLSWVNILANASMLEMTQRNLRQLSYVQDRPYFSRIDFTPDGSEKEKLYIGKTSLYRKDNQQPIIVDWRSPIANLYYEGQIGRVSYEANGETYTGDLSEKRQYVIDKGELQEIRDIDITARDEMLQESLTTNADHRLKDIVSTIQEEQNRIIRADMDRPLIVQGVAGSGKTTIALHRVAFFIYTLAESFKPEQMMIIAPNRLFLDYISDVLPELGVDEVQQTTFPDFVQQTIGAKLRFANRDEKLTQLLAQQNQVSSQWTEWVASYKGSLTFMQVLDRYLQDVIDEMVPKGDLTLERFTIYSEQDIKHWFFDEYTYLPPYRRIEKMKNVLKKQAKRKADEKIAQVSDVYDEKIEKVIYGIRDETQRRQKVTTLSNKKDEHIERLKNEAKKMLTTYFKQVKKHKVLDIYYDLMTDIEKLKTYGAVNDEEAKALAMSVQEKKAKTSVQLEDAAPLLYIHHRLYGVEEEKAPKYLVIDEAQDYNSFEFAVLKGICNSEKWTILGDLTQGIHSYRGTKTWQQLMDDVFPNAEYATLTQSYRTTVEIMTEANNMLERSEAEGYLLAQPVVRHDERPSYEIANTNQDFAVKVRDILALQGDTYQSFAIIGKTDQECDKIAKRLKEDDIEIPVLSDQDEEFNEQCVIVPSYLAKGLEFDVVVIATVDESYSENELDTKLLYVAMTRALHRLFFISFGDMSGMLGQLFKQTGQ
ncbi:RNA polymerase recycling motor HelD [Texcoconibacillus texcoconensis]|uniref:DNA helicase-2/ATP-dependent DNA helicase PcrA n=1 Tax=Texcoconibacillus texcoconensis TaxID=1095777 RepID=A0A840QPQ8_9BACI|nr:RNA polymerase recycling motor HelD [Texcoconibacillus texcoconensis]MBB5173307.1 DNA helicase-2/ATP-dependent DNA helicase PcrA [Texcoconibacillus texcoconensis]